MKAEKCGLCNGKGYYSGVIPPGKEVKVKCPCVYFKNNKLKIKD